MPLYEIKNYLHVKTLTKAILIALGTGTVVVMALMAPNALQIFKPFLGNGRRSNHERERIRQALRALRERRLIEYVERGDKMYLHVTGRGRKYIRQFEIDNFELPKGKWDKKWRVIFFDIPERKGGARRAFQQRLKTLGCFPLQKSVFVYPHECQDEIDTLASFWEVEPHVYYFVTTELGKSEGVTRKFFDLL